MGPQAHHVTVAFALSDGGNLGAAQVGMLQALQDRGVRPDLLVATSAGAINAAYLAGDRMSPQSLQGCTRYGRPCIAGTSSRSRSAGRRSP
jgi:predicted acylesterase/phospholipase RssA